jgi:hypothetical protein
LRKVSVLTVLLLFSAVTGTQYEEMVTAITSMGYERDQVHSSNFETYATTLISYSIPFPHLKILGPQILPPKTGCYTS